MSNLEFERMALDHSSGLYGYDYIIKEKVSENAALFLLLLVKAADIGDFPF
jgi:hypothetical protein